MMPPQLARSNRRHDRHSEPRPTIELMPAININELRHAIPRYHGEVNEPDVSLKYPDLAYLRLSASCLEIMGRNGYVQRFRIEWIRTGLGAPRAILVCSSCGPFGCSPAMALMLAGIATKHSTPRKSSTPLPVSACTPLSCDSNSAAGLTSTNQCRPSQNGHAAGLTNTSVTRSKPWKPKPRHGASANQYQHRSSPIT